MLLYVKGSTSSLPNMFNEWLSIYSGRIVNLDDYQLKPEVKKRRLEEEAENLKLSIKSLTSSLAVLQKQLEEKEKELKELK